MSAESSSGGEQVGRPRPRRAWLIGGRVAFSVVMIGAGIGIGAGIWSGGSSTTTVSAASNEAPSNATDNGPPAGLKTGDYEQSVTVDLVAPTSTIKWTWAAGYGALAACAYNRGVTPAHTTIGEGTTTVVFKFTVDNSFSFPSGGCAFYPTTVDFGGSLDREPPTPGGAAFGVHWAKAAGRSPNVSCGEHQLIQGTSKCRVVSADKIVFEWSANARLVEP